MDRVWGLIVSGLIALIVFIAGVYVGYTLLPQKTVTKMIVAKPDTCDLIGKWIQRYEELVKPYRELLPYRLEEGNYDPKLLDQYEFFLYQYYTLYKDAWKRCNLDPPVLYLAPRGAVNCGKLLDNLKQKKKFVVFPFIIEKDVEIAKTLAAYYGFDGKPLLIICGQKVVCDENAILRALESC